jgi:O-antigen ligase
MVLQYFAGASLNVADLIVSGSMADGGTGVTGNRVSGTLPTPAGAAIYLNSMLVVTLGAYLAGTLVNRKLALAAFCLGVIALIATSSRGGWVAFAVSMLLVLGRALWTGAGRKAIVLFLIGGALVGTFFGPQIKERVETIEEDQSREQLAYMANNIINAFPLGVGDNNYDQYLKDEYAHPAWVGQQLWPPHNKYLLNWAELGPQGLIAFWLLLLATIGSARRWLFRADIAPEFVIIGSGFLAGLVACMIHMYSETFEGRMHEELLWFTIAMLAVTKQFISQSKPMAPHTESKVKLADLKHENIRS